MRSNPYDYRRKLPHIQPTGKTFFINFCTHQRWILPESIRRIVIDACVYGEGKLFDLHGVVVMPDHVHLIITPFYRDDGPVSIPRIMQRIKSTSAHKINKTLRRTGRVWQHESFDRILRTEESLEAKLEYMKLNPVRAGLVQRPEDYRWLWIPQTTLPIAG